MGNKKTEKRKRVRLRQKARTKGQVVPLAEPTPVVLLPSSPSKHKISFKQKKKDREKLEAQLQRADDIEEKPVPVQATGPIPPWWPLIGNGCHEQQQQEEQQQQDQQQHEHQELDRQQQDQHEHEHQISINRLAAANSGAIAAEKAAIVPSLPAAAAAAAVVEHGMRPDQQHQIILPSVPTINTTITVTQVLPQLSLSPEVLVQVLKLIPQQQRLSSCALVIPGIQQQTSAETAAVAVAMVPSRQ